MSFSLFFFFNDTATTEIYTLSLHDALPIFRRGAALRPAGRPLPAVRQRRDRPRAAALPKMRAGPRLLLDLHDARGRPHAGPRGHAAAPGARGPRARLDGAPLGPRRRGARPHLRPRRLARVRRGRDRKSV